MIDLSALNGPQREAAEHVNGPLVMLAVAGSGKSTALMNRCANLIAHHGVDPSRMLVVTFTKKAANEMGEKLTKIIGSQRTRRMWLGTFHAMSARILRQHADRIDRRKDFVVYDESDQESVVRQIVGEKQLDKKFWTPKLVLARIEKAKQNALHPWELPQMDPEQAMFVQVWERYEEWLASCNAVDFEDLILKTMRLVEGKDALGEQLRGMFDHVMVDEFQDTNVTQYRLVKGLSCRTMCLGVVGDDDQAIYVWRGADPAYIRNFSTDFPDAKVIRLEQNYRSTGHVIAAANGVVKKVIGRVDKTLWTNAPDGARVKVYGADTDRDEAAWVCAGIRNLLGSQKVMPEEIAVLYRAHVQSRSIEDQLRDWNVPYRVHGGHRFYDRAEVKDLVAYLRLIENPQSDVDLLRIINVPSRGLGPGTVKRLGEIAKSRKVSLWAALAVAAVAPELGRKERVQLLAFRDLVTQYQRSSTGERPSALARRVLDGSGLVKLFTDQADAEAKAGQLSEAGKTRERADNLGEVVSAIAAYEDRCAERGQIPTLGSYLENVALVTSDERKSETVSLMTVHGSKGLEFEHVFVVGMEDGRFPLANDADDFAMAEERRLAYVAITRAKKGLSLSYAAMRYLRGQPVYATSSRFWDDLPPDAVERVRWKPGVHP